MARGRITYADGSQTERVFRYGIDVHNWNVFKADYRRASKLSRRVEILLDAIIADIACRREAFDCRAEHRGG